MATLSEKLLLAVQELRSVIDECERSRRYQADKDLLSELEKAIMDAYWSYARLAKKI